MAITTGTIEAFMTNGGWGGDLALDASGDLLLIQDTPQQPIAITQHLVRLIQTNPLLFEASTPISQPDDLFNTNYGSGIRALIGEPITQTILGGIQSRILNALSMDSAVSTDNPPIITAQDMGNGFVLINVTVYLITGQVLTLPSQQLQIFQSAI